MIEMYRDVLLYGKLPGFMDIGIVLFFGIFLFFSGSWIFRKLSPDLRKGFECSSRL